MKRRSFFSALAAFGSGAAVAAAPKLAEQVSTMKPDTFSIGGWKFRWMGWQSYPATFMIYGSWVATHEDSPLMFTYATTHGKVNEAHLGDVMDFSVPYGIDHITTPESSDEDKERKKTLALCVLMDFVQRSGRA